MTLLKPGNVHQLKEPGRVRAMMPWASSSELPPVMASKYTGLSRNITPYQTSEEAELSVSTVTFMEIPFLRSSGLLYIRPALEDG